MTLPLGPVSAFLDDFHLATAEAVLEFGKAHLASHPDPDTDQAARQRARTLVRELAPLYGPIERQDWRGCAITREGLAWHSPLADSVFALQALGTVPMRLAGSEEICRRWADAAIRGEVMTGFAMTEPGAGSDAGAIATTARLEGNEYVIDGSKTFITNAGIADVYVVFASTDRAAGARGLSAFVVPAGTEGLRFKGAQVMSAPHPLGELVFERCRVPAANRLGEEGKGLGIGLATLDRLRATVAAAACGMAGRALHEAVTHVRAREQFGKPLAEFQLVQDRLARMATDLDAARLLTYRAVWAKDRGADRVTLESAMAKSFATEAAQTVVDGAVQLLGGSGLLASHPVDRLYRAVRALRIYEGTTEIQRLLIAGTLLSPPPAPSS